MFNNILDSQREQNRVCNRDSAHFLVFMYRASQDRSSQDRFGQFKTGQLRTG